MIIEHPRGVPPISVSHLGNLIDYWDIRCHHLVSYDLEAVGPHQLLRVHPTEIRSIDGRDVRTVSAFIALENRRVRVDAVQREETALPVFDLGFENNYLSRRDLGDIRPGPHLEGIIEAGPTNHGLRITGCGRGELFGIVLGNFLNSGRKLINVLRGRLFEHPDLHLGFPTDASAAPHLDQELIGFPTCRDIGAWLGSVGIQGQRQQGTADHYPHVAGVQGKIVVPGTCGTAINGREFVFPITAARRSTLIGHAHAPQNVHPQGGSLPCPSHLVVLLALPAAGNR